MKIILTFSALFFSVSVFAEEIDVYYCLHEEDVGYRVSPNEKIHETTSFRKENFTLNVNFEKKTMLSEKIWMKGNIECIYSEFSKTLYCISEYGAALSFYFPDNKYALSQLFVNTEFDDDISLAYGYCEKF